MILEVIAAVLGSLLALALCAWAGYFVVRARFSEGGDDSVELRLPLAELSGLTLATIDGAQTLLAVGDEAWTIVGAGLDGQGARRLNIPPAADGSSEFEAIATDDAGRIYVMDEGRAAVRVYSLTGDTLTLEHTFALRVPAGHPLADDWVGAGNEGGEGLLVLPGGHLLVAKQRSPRALIEFGPEGAVAVGVTATAGAAVPALPSGARSELVPLAMWRPPKNTRKQLRSLNDLARAGDGSLYVVTSQPRGRVGRVVLPLRPGDDGFTLDNALEVPGGKKRRAEGLAITRAGQLVVGFDAKRGDVNVLVMPRPRTWRAIRITRDD